MIKKFNEFDKVNERLIPGQLHYDASNRNYNKELGDMYSEVYAKVKEALKYCVDSGIFDSEEINPGDFWYKLPNTINVQLSNYDEDYYDISEFQPEGSKVGNTVLGEGGMFFGVRPDGNDAEMETGNLDLKPMISLLEDLESWIKDSE